MLAAGKGVEALAQIDVFSFATAVTALLLAAGLLSVYLINRQLTAFRWWAASFLLLAIALATQTLRFDGPSHWIKAGSWASFYAAASLIVLGLYRHGATRSNPLLPVLAGGALYLAIATTLIATRAPPYMWFMLGPAPTLALMAWSLVPVLRAAAWGYGLAIGVGMMVIAARAAWFTNDLLSKGPLRGPRPGFGPGQSGLRGTLPADGTPPANVPLGPGGGAETLLSFRPPQGIRPPVEQPLTIALLSITALLALAVALSLRDGLRLLGQMHERSTTDPMTGLLNRATFDEQAGRLFGTADRHPVCLVLFDIDHFKRVNDTCGHLAGDRVIARLGQLIGDHIDTGAVAGRMGGEEFAVLFKGSGLSAARLFAEAMRTRFSASDLGDDIGWTVTLSAGIAMRDNDENLSSLIARADKALYAAKARGRDQVAVAADTADWQLRKSLATTA